MQYLCDECGVQFDVGEKLKVHMIQNHGATPHVEDKTHVLFQCDYCNKSVKGGLNLEKHVRNYHKIKVHKCSRCNYKSNRAYNLIEHKQTHTNGENSVKISHNNLPSQRHPSSPTTISAFRGKMQERAWFIRGSSDPLAALNEYKNRIRHVLYLSLKQNPQKFYIAVKVRFFKKDKDGRKTEDSAFFHGTMHTLLRKEEFEEAYQTSLQKIWKSFDIFIRNGSGWILDRVEKIFLNTYNYQPIGISSYIPTPQAIVKKKAVINVQNENNKKCFELSVLSALYHDEIDKKQSGRPSEYKKYLGKKLKGCKEPMTIDDIPRFETLNDISIAVYRIKHDGKTVFPLYMTKRRR